MASLNPFPGVDGSFYASLIKYMALWAVIGAILGVFVGLVVLLVFMIVHAA